MSSDAMMTSVFPDIEKLTAIFIIYSNPFDNYVTFSLQPLSVSQIYGPGIGPWISALSLGCNRKNV